MVAGCICDAPLACALSAHAELTEIGVIYRLRSTRNKKENDRFVTVHTFANSEDAS